jgi:hypothetical protein
MRPAVLLCSALLATVAGLAIACGGSSSETPWPTEPDPASVARPPELKPLPSTPGAADEDAGARRKD